MTADLAFLDDMDGTPGYTAPSTRLRYYRSGTPIEPTPALTDAERRAQYRPDRPTIRRDETWKIDGACKTSTLNFFPEKNENTDRQRTVCAGCPVREPCLEYAVTHHELGIWGGTSERERRRLRKTRAA